MTHHPLIETVAQIVRAECALNPADPDFLAVAIKTLRAIEAAGYRIVQIDGEQTKEMIAAVRWVSSGWVRGCDHARETWKAMLAVAPRIGDET